MKVKKMIGMKFHLTKSRPLTTIPFCRRMFTHKRPARLAEKVNENAPKLEPSATAKIALLRMRGSALTVGESMKLGSLMISTSSIAAPMFA